MANNGFFMKKHAILLLILVLMILAGCSGDRTAVREPTVVPTTVPEATAPQTFAAPDFTVYDIDGNSHRLSDFQGKPVILNFWASWCGPYKAEMPDFEDAYKIYGEKIHFLMVNLTDGRGETIESASTFIAGQGYTFPVYYDTAYSGANAYSITSIPTTFFINKDGNLVTYGQGMLSADLLAKGIEMILPES